MNDREIYGASCVAMVLIAALGFWIAVGVTIARAVGRIGG
jgi:hypothetical protein